MSDPNLSEPDSPPPPAYEFCQEEFDQKVAHALEASQSEPQRSADEEEEWEAWNESVFEAAAAQLTLSDTQEASSSRSPTTASASASASHSRAFSGAEGSNYGAASSSSNNPENGVQPLRIVKKLSAKEKERPSWYAEAQLEGDNPTSQDASVITNHPRSSLRRADTYIERQQTPPPMFTDIGPSLDGPPYEGLVLTYVPGDSNPPSPLQSPRPISIFGNALPPPPPPLSPPASSTHRRSLPQPPVGQINSPPVSGGQMHRISPKPPTISSSINYPAPRVTFNPQVAYSNIKSSDRDRSGEESHLPQRIDAASFYNSSVSSLYSSSIPPRVPINTPSMYSQPSVSQSSYLTPKPQVPPPQGIGGIFTGREHLKSPAPSEQSYIQNYGPASSQTNVNVYQPTTYQPTSYQPTTYQPTSYQPTTYQSTSYQPTTYQPTPYSDPRMNASGMQQSNASRNPGGRPW